MMRPLAREKPPGLATVPGNCALSPRWLRGFSIATNVVGASRITPYAGQEGRSGRLLISHPWRKKEGSQGWGPAALLQDHKSPGCYWMQTGRRNISKPPVSDGSDASGPPAVWRTRSFWHERARSGQSSRRCWWISAVQHSRTSPSHCRRQPLPPGRHCRGHSAGSG